MFAWLYFSAVGVAYICYSIYESRTNARARKNRLSAFEIRERLDREEWYRRYFAESGLGEGPAVALFELIARAIGCDLTQLRPDDAFNGSLAFKGISFLGIDCDDLLSDFWEYEFPPLVGGSERANAIVDQIQREPTLRALARAIASTAQSSQSPLR